MVPTLDAVAALYPSLPGGAAPGWRDDVTSLGDPIRVETGQVLFDEGAPCQGFPLVLSGEVRVARGAPQGRSLELYRVVPGEVCLVSASCLFGQVPLSAHGLASRASELLLVPPAMFMRWAEHEAFRRWVFGIFAARMGDLIELAEAVAFQRLDQRLASALLGRGASVRITHQQLADELGTVREIVTRLLKRFETAGWVALGRERIDIKDAAALRSEAGGRP